MEKPTYRADGPSQNSSGPQGSLLDQYIASQQQQQRRHDQHQVPLSPGSNANTTNNHGQQQQQQQQSTAQVTETSGVLRLCLDLPGVACRDVDVTIHRGVLMVRGVRKTYSVDRRHVIKKVQFVRRFAIDTDVVDIQHAKANLAKGVLVVMAPKKHAPHGIRIPVTEDPKWNPFRQSYQENSHSSQAVAAAAAAVKVEETTDAHNDSRPDVALSSSSSPFATIVSDDTGSDTNTSQDNATSDEAEDESQAADNEKQRSRSSSASTVASTLSGSKRKVSDNDPQDGKRTRTAVPPVNQTQ